MFAFGPNLIELDQRVLNDFTSNKPFKNNPQHTTINMCLISAPVTLGFLHKFHNKRNKLILFKYTIDELNLYNILVAVL